MPATPLPLPDLIERNKQNQNGHGWVDFRKIATSPVRPSISKIAKLFNRNFRTVQRWLDRYDEEMSVKK